MHTPAQGVRRFVKTTTATFVLVLLSLFVFVFTIPNKVKAEVIYSLNPDYGSIQQEGKYVHFRTGFACNTSNITIGFTNVLSNIASDIGAEGAIQDNEGEYIDFDPPISSGVWYFSLANLYSGFDTIYPVSYFTNLWPNREGYKAVLDCDTGSGTIRSWFLINAEEALATSTTDRNIGDIKFGMAIMMTFMFLTFVTFIFNRTFKSKKW